MTSKCTFKCYIKKNWIHFLCIKKSVLSCWWWHHRPLGLLFIDCGEKDFNIILNYLKLFFFLGIANYKLVFLFTVWKSLEHVLDIILTFFILIFSSWNAIIKNSSKLLSLFWWYSVSFVLLCCCVVMETMLWCHKAYYVILESNPHTIHMQTWCCKLCFDETDTIKTTR